MARETPPFETTKSSTPEDMTSRLLPVAAGLLPLLVEGALFEFKAKDIPLSSWSDISTEASIDPGVAFDFFFQWT